MILRTYHRARKIRTQSLWRVRYNGQSCSGDDLDLCMIEVKAPTTYRDQVVALISTLKSSFPAKKSFEVQIVTE